MSMWRTLLKQIADKPVVHGGELYKGYIADDTIRQALDWLQAHRLVRSLGTGKTGFYCATVLGEHIAKGVLPLERQGRGNSWHVRFPSGKTLRLARHVVPQPHPNN